MTGPRDPAPRYGVPVNSDTGKELTDNQVMHLAALKEAASGLYEAMHRAEGSNPPGDHAEHTCSGRRMAHAATLLETSLMFSRKAALE
jgi:hypothetical protein